MGMWFEIIPPVAIMTGLYMAVSALGNGFNRVVHGVPTPRQINHTIDMHMWKRDHEHSYPHWAFKHWQLELKGQGSPYKTHGLEKYD